MGDKVKGVRDSISKMLDACAETRKSCESVLSENKTRINHSEELDKKWNEFKAKFDQVNKALIGQIGASIGQDASISGMMNGMMRQQTNDEEVFDQLPIEEREAVFGGEISMQRLCSKIKNGSIKKVVIMAGAGISVSAGIPDFRSKGGLYDRSGKRQVWIDRS